MADIIIGIDDCDDAFLPGSAGSHKVGQILDKDFSGAFLDPSEPPEPPAMLGAHSRESGVGGGDGAVGRDDSCADSIFSLEEHPAPSPQFRSVFAFGDCPGHRSIHSHEHGTPVLEVSIIIHSFVVFVERGLYPGLGVGAEDLCWVEVVGEVVPLCAHFVSTVDVCLSLPH